MKRFAFTLIIAACNSAPPPAAPEPMSAVALVPPPSGQGVQLTVSRLMAPGSEIRFCKEFTLPTGAGPVEKLEHQYTAGAHHLIAYKTAHKEPAMGGSVFECAGIDGPIVYESQVDSESSRFPPGVGISFAAGEVLQLEVHFINATRAPITASGALNLWFASRPLTGEVGTFFMYDEDIGIPAHGTFTAKMHCVIPSDLEILFLQPHMHLFGRAERIMLSGKVLLESTGFGDLATRHFEDQPIAVKAGQAIDFECDYQNDGDTGIVDGQSKTMNEMCMVLGAYYPRMADPAAEWCKMAGSGPLHEGTKRCIDALMCAQSMSDTTYAGELCYLDVCKASSDALNDVTNCGYVKCQDQCPGMNCGTCTVQSCAAEFMACAKAACD